MSDISDLLRRIERLEGAMAALYGWYATVFSEDPEAAALFKRLESEEGTHGDLARFQKALVAKNRRLFQPVDADLGNIDRVVSDVQVFRESASRPLLSDALVFAMRIEKDAAEQHCRTAMMQANPELAQFVSALSKGDQLHLEALRELAVARGVALPENLREPA